MATNLTETNQRQVKPDLRSLLDLVQDEVMDALNCHAIGTVQAFDTSKQTIQATINYKKTINGKLVDYPIILDCPMIIMTGGTACLTLPVTVGDTCLLLFNDVDIDTWFSSGQAGLLSSGRRHSFTDAVALVGLRSLANSVSDYDPIRAVLRNGASKVAIGTLIEISNTTGTLKTVINGLIDIIKAISTTPTVPGSPATLDPTVIAQLELYKTTVGGLLE